MQPGTTGSYLLGIRFFMNPAFAPRFPFEMFDYIGDISLRAVNAGFFQGAVKQSSGGTNKRFPAEILFVARLFTNEHDPGPATAVAKNSLCPSLPEIAGF